MILLSLTKVEDLERLIVPSPIRIRDLGHLILLSPTDVEDLEHLIEPSLIEIRDLGHLVCSLRTGWSMEPIDVEKSY